MSGTVLILYDFLSQHISWSKLVLLAKGLGTSQDSLIFCLAKSQPLSAKAWGWIHREHCKASRQKHPLPRSAWSSATHQPNNKGQCHGVQPRYDVLMHCETSIVIKCLSLGQSSSEFCFALISDRSLLHDLSAMCLISDPEHIHACCRSISAMVTAPHKSRVHRWIQWLPVAANPFLRLGYVGMLGRQGKYSTAAAIPHYCCIWDGHLSQTATEMSSVKGDSPSPLGLESWEFNGMGHNCMVVVSFNPFEKYYIVNQPIIFVNTEKF